MQRSALAIVTALVVAGGCAPRREAPGWPPPNPLLATRAPRKPVAAVRPPPPPPRPRQPTVAPDTTSRSWIPAGGIKKGRWKVIVVHHSASPEATPQGMDSFHRRQRNFANGLGYHFVIGNGVNYPDGKIFVGSRWRRQIHGAHCKTGSGRYFGRRRPSGYFNKHGIGVCLIGNFETGWPTRKQLAALRKLTAFLCDQSGISPDEIFGHGEVTHHTACPGSHLNMVAVRRSVRAAVAARRDEARRLSALWRYAPALLLAASLTACGCTLLRAVRAGQLRRRDCESVAARRPSGRAPPAGTPGLRRL